MANRTENSINPYAVLGVNVDATFEDVKAAYRRRAKDTHPDAGGSSQEFYNVKLAHFVLADAERRERYDRTGEVKEAEPDNTDPRALELIGAMLKAFLEAEPDPNECDLVSLMKAHLVTELGAANGKLRVTRRAIKRAEQMRGRFRRKKPGDNPVQRILEWQINDLKKVANLGEATIKQRERALELLNDYDFVNDISAGPFRVHREVQMIRN